MPNPSESTYRVPSSNEPLPLPSLLTTPATVELSVIVPAYNERARLGIMLRDAVRYLEELPLSERGAEEVVAGRSGAGRRELPRGVERGSYEVLVVDDGSKDGTTQVALELAAELETQWSAKGRRPRGVVKVVTLVKNRGKGGCVKHVRVIPDRVSLRELMGFDRDRASSMRPVTASCSRMRTARRTSPTSRCCKTRWTGSKARKRSRWTQPTGKVDTA